MICKFCNNDLDITGREFCVPLPKSSMVNFCTKYECYEDKYELYINNVNGEELEYRFYYNSYMLKHCKSIGIILFHKTLGENRKVYKSKYEFLESGYYNNLSLEEAHNKIKKYKQVLLLK